MDNLTLNDKLQYLAKLENILIEKAHQNKLKKTSKHNFKFFFVNADYKVSVLAP